MSVRLYMFDGSNSCVTALLMLDHKGIEFERVELFPAVHALVVRRLGFPKTTVPAMFLDGKRVQGTLNISEALDAAYPDRPALFPDDPSARERVRAAEVFGEKFQKAARRIFYGAARRDRGVFAAFLGGGARSATSSWLLRAATPLIIKIASKGHGSTDERVRQDLARLPENLDRIDGWLSDGTLGGELPNAADCQIAPNVRAMLQFADLLPLFDGRPCADWSRTLVPEYGDAIAPVLPRGWVPQPSS